MLIPKRSATQEVTDWSIIDRISLPALKVNNQWSSDMTCVMHQGHDTQSFELIGSHDLCSPFQLVFSVAFRR